jgi:hypothetical protein
MKIKIFKANIAGQVISLYRRKRFDDSILFDSIIQAAKKSKRSPNKELRQRLFDKTEFNDEMSLLRYLKGMALINYGSWHGNLQEAIWEILRKP